MSAFIDTLVAICNLAVLPIFGLFYVAILWIIIRKTEVKSSIAYFILLVIGLLDLLHMVTSFLAGFNNFFPRSSLTVFGAIGSCARNGYLVAVPILELLLALNRLTVVLRFRDNPVGRAVTKVLILLCACIPIPTLYLLSIFNSKIKFSYHESTYRYEGPAYFEKPFIFSRVTVVSSTLITYSVILLVIIAQKKCYGSKFQMSTKELRLLLQALFQSLPLSFVILGGAFLFQEIWLHGAVYVLWNLTAINIPSIHLMTLIGFNSVVRSHFLTLIGVKKQLKLFTATARMVSVAMISAKSSVQ